MFCKAIVRGLLATAMVVLAADEAMADTFGTGGNQFTIDFVNISGAANPSGGIPAGNGFIFTGVANDYRMGTYEITNDQWNKFTASLGVPVTGSPSDAYDESFQDWGTGTTDVPANGVSWYEAAQFVNWLNTSTGNQAAYKFTGTQGTGDYTLATWSPAEASGGTNLYRNKAAKYYLPTEHEWVKAAYWNGTSLQNYATKAGDTLFQGNGTNGGWNYYDGDIGPDGPAEGPWNVGSGSQELNGTYDMMGNVWEWLESPYSDVNYGAVSLRGVRGGVWENYPIAMVASTRIYDDPVDECFSQGFRVASVPEPGSLAMLAGIALTALLYCWRKHL